MGAGRPAPIPTRAPAHTQPKEQRYARRQGHEQGMVVFGAVLIQLCLGAIYAWSVFTPALIDAGWSKLQTQVVFSVGLATFAVAMVWAGRKLPQWGPRRLSWLGGAVLGLGYAMAGLTGGGNFLGVTCSSAWWAARASAWPTVVPIAVACAGSRTRRA